MSAQEEHRLHLPRIEGPRDVPVLRQWMIEHWGPNSTLSAIPDSRFMQHHLPAAKLWWVEPETCDLLAAAAPTWPDDAVLDLADMPTPCGLAVFAHDFIGMDAHPKAGGHEVFVSAILWGPSLLGPVQGSSLGVSVAMFSRLVMDEGLSKATMNWAAHDLNELAAKLDMLHRRGESSSATNVHGHLYSFVGRTDWIEGWPAHKPILSNPHGDDPIAAKSMAEDRKLLAALWALTRSVAVQSVEEHPPRHVARKSTRKGLDPTVRVLRLGTGPSSSTTASGASTVDWKNSWVVSPHFRWQPFGPARAQRRLILVGPYTKGPADKPLIHAERVWRIAPPKP